MSGEHYSEKYISKLETQNPQVKTSNLLNANLLNSLFSILETQNFKLKTQTLQSNIYLIGYMAVGKTTFGKQLAAALGYAFADLDALIEKEEGSTIATIFTTKGEAYFREKEKLVLHKTQSLHNYVIACGGGTPCFFDNMEFIYANGISIWMKAPIYFIVQRLANASGVRPLTEQQQGEALHNYVQEQLVARTPYYEKSKLIYETATVTKQDFIIFVKSFILEENK